MDSRTGYSQSLISLSLSIAGGLLVNAVSMPVARASTSDLFMSSLQIAISNDSFTQAQEAYQLGRYEEARIAWEQAYAEAERRGDRISQISILNALCTTYRELGDWEQSELLIERSLNLLASVDTNNPPRILLEAQTVNTQAALLLASGQTKEAYELWVKSEQLYQQTADSEGIIGSRINQVQALQAMGLYRQAYLQLVELEEELAVLPNSSLKVAGLKSLGDVFQVTGNLEEAQKALEASTALAEQIGDHSLASSAWLSLGNAYRGVGENEAAIEAYRVATEVAATPVSEATAALSELSLLIEAERWEAVENRLAMLSPLVINLEPSRMGIYAKVNLAATLQALLNQDRASTTHVFTSSENIAQLLSTAVTHAQRIKDQRAEAYALGQLGSLYEQAQQFGYALSLTNQALALADSISARDIAYRWQWQKGRILREKSQLAADNNSAVEQFEAAIAAYRDSVDTLKQIRSDLVAADSSIRFSFRDNVEPVYREFVDLLVRPEASEEDLQLARQAIEDLQLAEIQNFFRSACLDIQAQQIDQLDPTAAVIYPVILPNRLAVITSLPGKPLQSHSVLITEETLDHTTNEFLQTLNPVFSNTTRLSIAQKLHQWLLEPLVEDLYSNQIETLVFILDGSLRNIPIAALHNGQKYLIEEFNVALTPGLQLLPPQSSTTEQTNVLAGAITEAHRGFPALPGVAHEIEEISAAFPTKVFLNENFTASNLQEEVNRNSFPIVHLATHGQFSSKVGETFLLGWEKPLQIQDFQILVREQLPQIRRPIELLVLSACQTAEGDDRAALGLAGFAVRSGARSTLATLWSVNDQSTALVIAEFYHQLSQKKAITKVRALREAQLNLLNDSEFSHPFYWAPFVLVGNWL